jgi:hypothetical protein
MPLSLITTETGGLGPLTVSELQALQAEQFEHDEKFHREIARLSVQDRLRHMTLHFSKYVGRLLQAQESDQKVIVDTFIIALSSANILGVHLSPDVVTRPSLTRQDFVTRLGVATGQMSAACEKLDHLEDFPFRLTLHDGVVDIAAAVMSYAFVQKLDLPKLVRKRLTSVRGKAFVPGRN